MSNLANQMILFAQKSRLDYMRGRFSGRRTRIETEDIVTTIIVVGLIALGVYLLAKISAGRDKSRSYKSPRSLFSELCRAHGMSRAEKRLLRQVARWQRLAQPARLFLEPDRFDSANLSPQLQGRVSELLAIRDTIYAQPIPEERQTETEPQTSAGEPESGNSSEPS